MATFNPETAETRTDDGSLIDEVALLAAVNAFYASTVAEPVIVETERLIDGDAGQEAYRRRVKRLILLGFLAATLIGRGGQDSTEDNDLSLVAASVALMFAQIDDVLAKFAGGILSPGLLRAQMATIVGKGVSAFHQGNMIAHRIAGFTRERRFLQPGSESCPDCVGYAAQGIQAIGTLPAPGIACRCQGRCNCRKVFLR